MKGRTCRVPTELRLIRCLGCSGAGSGPIYCKLQSGHRGQGLGLTRASETERVTNQEKVEKNEGGNPDSFSLSFRPMTHGTHICLRLCVSFMGQRKT